MDGKSKFSPGLSELCVWELILLTLDFPCETKNQFRFGEPGGFTSKLLFYKSFPRMVGTRGERVFSNENSMVISMRIPHRHVP